MFEGPLPTAATFSKSPKMWGANFWPSQIQRGTGARVVDDKGRPFADWVSALGANLLGYSHRQFCERVSGQIYGGAGFTLPHVLERQVAEKLVALLGSRVPGWTPDGLGARFGLSGTDATTMAIRLARAVTGRTRILSSGYHGWADWSISVTPPAWGIPQPQCVIDFRFNDLVQLEALTVDAEMCNEPIAAIILEQPMQEPDGAYYRYLREMCNRIGALLIIDEVVTFPRYALGGACECYGITPDIVCIAKALGNGVPISAMVFRREFGEWFSRQDPCFISSTGFGNAVSLAAADAVLDLWNQAGVDHLWQIGQALMDGLREAGYSLIGNPPRMLIQFPSNAHKGYFTLRMRDWGILWNRPTLPNLAHTLADVELTVKAAREIKSKIDAMGPDKLAEAMRGREPMVLFSGR